jgi:hypothetical protein
VDRDGGGGGGIADPAAGTGGQGGGGSVSGERPGPDDTTPDDIAPDGTTPEDDTPEDDTPEEASPARRRKESVGQTIGGVLFGFEQQVLRTMPPSQELVHHARPDAPIPAGDGSLIHIGMPGLVLPDDDGHVAEDDEHPAEADGGPGPEPPGDR